MLIKAKHKTRLTQNKSKTHKFAKTKHKEREESDRIIWSPFPSIPQKNPSFD